MQIWVDADACPAVVKDILFKAADRTSTQLILVANQYLNVPNSPFIRFRQVEKGFDVADNEIARAVSSGDLVITADIPLANDVIEKGAVALSPRGELYTVANIKARLTMRNFMDTMRSSGVETGGAPPYSQQDRREFANQLDRFLQKNAK